jgi:NUMOD3 motif-containing protein
MDGYYVYRHIRLDTDTPFYVGKGKKSRAYIKYNRNKHWKNIVAKAGYRVEIICSGMAEESAFAAEIEYIRLYKSQGFCEANVHPGGDLSTVDQSGPNNHMYGKTGERHPNYGRTVHSEEQREVWSLARQGSRSSEDTKNKLSKIQSGEGNGFFGKKHTPEALTKMSQAKRGKPNVRTQKRVIDLQSGIVFDSATEAALSKGLQPKTLMNKLTGKRPNHTNLKYID